MAGGLLAAVGLVLSLATLALVGLRYAGIDTAVGDAALPTFGSWLAEAANEAATQIEATVFTAPALSSATGSWTAHPSAEIAEIRWLDLSGDLPDDLAPLLTDHVLPLLAARADRRG